MTTATLPPNAAAPWQQRLLILPRQLLAAAKARWYQRHQTDTQIKEAPDTSNPYIAARREWNVMFGDLIKAKYNWQRIAFLALSANVLLIIGLLWLSGQSRYVPYAVKVDALGNTAFAGYLSSGAQVNPLELNAFIRRWVSNARSVIGDPVAQKQALDFVYSGSTDTTAQVLNDFYQQNNPFKTAAVATIEVNVNAVLQKSDKTWQVDWTELQRNPDGKTIAQTHWEGLITVGQHPVKGEAAVNINPLGLFVERISWSQQL